MFFEISIVHFFGTLFSTSFLSFSSFRTRKESGSSEGGAFSFARLLPCRDAAASRKEKTRKTGAHQKLTLFPMLKKKLLSNRTNTAPRPKQKPSRRTLAARPFATSTTRCTPRSMSGLASPATGSGAPRPGSRRRLRSRCSPNWTPRGCSKKSPSSSCTRRRRGRSWRTGLSKARARSAGTTTRAGTSATAAVSRRRMLCFFEFLSFEFLRFSSSVFLLLRLSLTFLVPPSSDLPGPSLPSQKTTTTTASKKKAASSTPPSSSTRAAR